jgi:RHS repeat-associated protein
VLEEKLGSITTARYVWSPVYVNSMILRDRDTNSDGTMDERLWAVQDANWNTVALVDASQAVVERYTYDPFGTVTVYDGSYAVRTGGSSYASVVLFQGMIRDLISGIDTANERNYDSKLRAWTQPDPSGFAANDDNLYRFVGNDPADNSDPTGLQMRGRPLFPNRPRRGGGPRIEIFGGQPGERPIAQYPYPFLVIGGRIRWQWIGPRGGIWTRYGPSAGIDAFPPRIFVAPLGGIGWTGRRGRVQWMLTPGPSIGPGAPFGFDLGPSIRVLPRLNE